MSYWKKSTGNSTAGLDSNTLGGGYSNSSALPEFHETEPGLVLDIILDKNHAYFKGPPSFNLDPERFPPDINGNKPLISDPDFTWMGKALIRLAYTQRRVEKEDLVWAMPAESNISEYPLLNEIVEVIQVLGVYYYRRKINLSNFVSANPDFNLELLIGGFKQSANSPIEGNRELQINTSRNQESNYTAYKGPKSKMTVDGGKGWSGVLGRYFLFNESMRSLKRREGDLVFESRFGQSIRFGAYDDNRSNDNSPYYTDYMGDGQINPYSGKPAGGGNPMILIRNRQRPITSAGKNVVVYPSPVPPVVGTSEEKNAGGYIIEDVNNDGSSIHMTSGATKSEFVTTCAKKMWGTGEEQQAFQPNGATTFQYPKLLGDQIVINSDRIILSSKAGEMFQFSKKRMSLVTDDEFTIDAQNQIVLTTNNKTVINSPAIYLGEYNQTGEPVLLGQTSVNWLYELCNWLLGHTHYHWHNHPDAELRTGFTYGAEPVQTQTTVQWAALQVLQGKLHTLLSRRVFVTGGGFSPGKNGGAIPNGSAPIAISTSTGAGVPGGWAGANKR